MKKLIVFAFILLPWTFAMAQSQQSKREKIESFRIAYYTQQLNLSTEEAQKFWPVYNAMQDELRELRKQTRLKINFDKEQINKLSDAEAEALVDGEIKYRQAKLNIESKYHEKFKSVLPVKKVAQFYHTQEDFKRELLKLLRAKQN